MFTVRIDYNLQVIDLSFSIDPYSPGKKTIHINHIIIDILLPFHFILSEERRIKVIHIFCICDTFSLLRGVFI